MIYDLAGREVSSWDLQQQSGYKQIDWNGKDQKGVLVPAGVYIYRLTAKSVDSDQHFSATRKMLFLKQPPYTPLQRRYLPKIKIVYLW
jgi:flagellar hook assembly protein FlgD